MRACVRYSSNGKLRTHNCTCDARLWFIRNYAILFMRAPKCDLCNSVCVQIGMWMRNHLQIIQKIRIISANKRIEKRVKLMSERMNERVRVHWWARTMANNGEMRMLSVWQHTYAALVLLSFNTFHLQSIEWRWAAIFPIAISKSFIFSIKSNTEIWTVYESIDLWVPFCWM